VGSSPPEAWLDIAPEAASQDFLDAVGALARFCVGFVRADTGAASEPRLAQLIGELSLSDADFRTWWAERHASYAVSGTKTLTHPLTGSYTLDWQVLRLPENDQILMVMTAPDAANLEAFRLLATQP
jgi:hypothetical protein